MQTKLHPQKSCVFVINFVEYKKLQVFALVLRRSMEFKPDSTTNKLIILYVLDKMEIPLTENSILEICTSQNDWLNWIECKDLLSQLITANFVYKPSADNEESRYNITVNGRGCISEFYSRIPSSLRAKIDQFAAENKMQFKRNQEYVSKYYKNEDGSYSVELKILEPLTAATIFGLTVKADTRNSAMLACKKWRDIAPTIYETVYNKIIEN